jgi:hypothetical protein
MVFLKYPEIFELKVQGGHFGEMRLGPPRPNQWAYQKFGL